MPPSASRTPRTALAALTAFLVAAVAVAAAVEPAAAPAATPATTPAATPSATPAAASPRPPCPDGMRPLVGGAFTLADGSATVEVAPFCLDAIEVTAAGYAACVRASVCSAEDLACSKAATYGAAGKGNHPINCVSWIDADTFCRWQGKRLPTEGEWEWAARGQGQGTRYPWGESPPARRACWDGKGSSQGAGGRSGTCPVATHPDGDSPDGLHDLAGNVREWTSTGDQRERVIRGGSWGDSLDWFLAAGFRGFNHPLERFELTGFRCAADPASPPAGDDPGVRAAR